LVEIISKCGDIIITKQEMWTDWLESQVNVVGIVRQDMWTDWLKS
jgi:hypothetical protein